MLYKRKVISKRHRNVILSKCFDKCAYCGCDITLKTMQVDHYHPVALATDYRIDFRIDVFEDRNLLPSCRTCNHYKRADTPEFFRKKMTTLHERLNKNYINKVALTFGMVTINKFSGYFYFEYLMFGIESHNMDSFPIHPAIDDSTFFEQIAEMFHLE